MMSMPPHYTLSKEDNPSLRELVEVWALCDRFICAQLGDYMATCIKTAVNDCHCLLLNFPNGTGNQKNVTCRFADGYDALGLAHQIQERFEKLFVEYFCGSMSYNTYVDLAADIKDRQSFILSVSRGFAKG
ncbi:hypothetical protein GMORB2_7358 [Geosmithia morbida]|uniref:Uncharacterized protein n=1 Tax=Geosmithia morbida TaxID=1094350 RepID=A0A9P4YVA6_9HYPO|nr:uncharacterized protein GMORB2_7358 [Geosmithia morbida]KAF4122366.1 hypothetical protein GMORB2_7358 [Geosmithia morbida]